MLVLPEQNEILCADDQHFSTQTAEFELSTTMDPSAPHSLPNLHQVEPTARPADHSARLGNSLVDNGVFGESQNKPLQTSTDTSQTLQSISIERPVYTQPHFDEVIAQSQPDPRYSKTAKDRLNGIKDKFRCSAQCTKQFLFGVLPFIGIMKDYNIRTDLLSDILAGLTVGIMQIPQGNLSFGVALDSNADRNSLHGHTENSFLQTQ